MKEIQIRRYDLVNSQDLQSVMYGAILGIQEEVYSEKEKQVWLKGLESNLPDILNRLSAQLTFGAYHDNDLIGFCSMSRNGYIDMFYVNHSFQHMGIGRALFDQLEEEVMELRLAKVFTYASKAALGLFQRRGLKIVERCERKIDDVVIVNFRMEKIY